MKIYWGGILLVAAGLLLTACTASSTAIKAGELSIEDAWVRAAAVMGQTKDSMHTAGEAGTNTAAFFTIRNQGSQPDRLLAVESTAAKAVEIHQTKMENDIMRMSPLPDGIEIPAGGEVSLAPGGLHIMLIGLKEDLKAGSSLELTLVFEQAGRVSLTVPVKGME